MAETIARRSPFSATLTYAVGVRDAGAEEALAEELGVSPLLAAALRARGYTTVEEARAFLEPSLDDLGDPETLPDFDAAAKILLAAIAAGDLITIHGDYDADGVTSAALLYRFLKAAKANVEVFVPHRAQGYGVSIQAVEDAHARGTKVFLTCDCGVAAFESLELAMSYGMRVVVTDHHLPQDTVPQVDAMVNTHLAGSQYPEENLCGAGVAFRFCEGLAARMGMNVEKYRERFAEFAAIGTVADMMPLSGENRIIVAYGLRRLERTTTPGLARLKEHARVGVGTRMTARDIGFGIGPRLNAVGRIDAAAKALQLLLAKDELEAEALALVVEEKNTERKAVQREIVDQAIALVEEQGLGENLVIMVRGPKWQKGIVGLAASKILERYGRPTFVLSYDPETGRYGGSGRSVDGVSLFELIQASRELGVDGGGHAGAAGIGFHEDHFERIFAEFERCAWEQVGPDGLPRIAGADFEAELGELSVPAVQELGRMEPCGRGNESLTLLARGVEVLGVMPTKRESSMRYKFGTRTRSFIGITHAHEPGAEPKVGERVDLFFRPQINEWNGSVSVQLEVCSILPSTL